MRVARLAFVCALLMLFFAGRARALTKEEQADIRLESSNFKYDTVTTKEGLSFRVPEDMPIETRNGIEAPIPFDEYMYGKFKQMDLRFKSIETKLDEIQKALILMNKDRGKVSDVKNGAVERNDKILKG